MKVLKGRRIIFCRCKICQSLLSEDDLEIDSGGDVCRQIVPCTNCLTRAANEAANEAVKELETALEPTVEEWKSGTE